MQFTQKTVTILTSEYQPCEIEAVEAESEVEAISEVLEDEGEELEPYLEATLCLRPENEE